jgi:hypothetical protein
MEELLGCDLHLTLPEVIWGGGGGANVIYSGSFVREHRRRFGIWIECSAVEC